MTMRERLRRKNQRDDCQEIRRRLALRKAHVEKVVKALRAA